MPQLHVSGHELDKDPQLGPAESAISNPLLGMSEEEIQALVKSIYVVVLRQHAVCGQLLSVAWNWGAAGLRFGNVQDMQGGSVEIARGLCERSFLEFADQHPEIKFLVFVDSDEEPSPDAPLRLARWNLPIVSGVVCGYSPERGLFACFQALDDKGVPRFPSYMYTKTLPSRGLKKVHAAGTGLLCIRKDVIETMIDKGMHSFLIDEESRKSSYRTGIQRAGEDISFCRKAFELGFDIYVDFSVRAGHYKVCCLGWPESGLDDDLDAREWHPTSLDYMGPR